MATRAEEPGTPDRRHALCRRQFLHWLVGGAGFALLLRSAHAAPMPGERTADLPAAGEVQQWCPGPDWERVPPSKPGGVGGWRNKKTGEFRTDWFPRTGDVSVIEVQGPIEVVARAGSGGSTRFRLFQAPSEGKDQATSVIRTAASTPAGRQLNRRLEK